MGTDLQIQPGKPAALADMSGGGGLLAAQRIGLDAAQHGEVVHIAFGSSAKPALDAYERMGRTEGLSVVARAPGSLGDAGELSKLATGKRLVVLEGFRAGVAGGDPWAVLATLEAVSTETGAAFLCVLSSHAPELLDAFGCVIEVARAERKGSAQAYPVRQLQSPRGVLDGFAPTFLVVEALGDGVACAFDEHGSSATQRAQVLEDADLMAESLLDHPGRVLPQLEGVTYDRCAAAAKRLEVTGRVRTEPAGYGVVRYFPSEQERQAREALDGAVLRTIDENPDILASSLPARAKLAPEAVTKALARLGSQVRTVENGGEVAYLTEVEARRREQRAAVVSYVRNTRRFTVDSVAIDTGAPSDIVREVLSDETERGDVVLVDPALGVYEFTTHEIRAVRKVALAAKKGMVAADVAESAHVGEAFAQRVLTELFEAGLLVTELKSGAIFYKAAPKAA